MNAVAWICIQPYSYTYIQQHMYTYMFHIQINTYTYMNVYT